MGVKPYRIVIKLAFSEMFPFFFFFSFHRNRKIFSISIAVIQAQFCFKHVGDYNLTTLRFRGEGIIIKYVTS